MTTARLEIDSFVLNTLTKRLAFSGYFVVTCPYLADPNKSMLCTFPSGGDNFKIGGRSEDNGVVYRQSGAGEGAPVVNVALSTSGHVDVAMHMFRSNLAGRSIGDVMGKVVEKFNEDAKDGEFNQNLKTLGDESGKIGAGIAVGAVGADVIGTILSMIPDTPHGIITMNDNLSDSANWNKGMTKTSDDGFWTVSYRWCEA